MTKPLKPRKCKTCGQTFEPRNSLQRVCSQRCALDLANKQREKREARELREGRDRLKTRSDHAKEAQAAVNDYVRKRDEHLPCISCGKPASWNGQWHASHFRSVGAASSIRFNLWNIHKSCSVCNNWKSGNLSEYEPRLREKIGDEKVDWLRTQTQPRTYSIEYLIRLKKIFRKKTRKMNVKRDIM